MSIIISNERDPITLEPLENCRRTFAFLHKNVATEYDFDNYKENIKKIGPIKPHTGERLTCVDKLSMNDVWKHYNEPIPFPEVKNPQVKKKKEKTNTELIIDIIGWVVIFVGMIVEFIFLCKCDGLKCLAPS
jgi:hypothetical protein